MKKTTSYKTTFRVYYSFGSTWSGDLTDTTIGGITDKIIHFKTEQADDRNAVELVTFSPIEKIVTTYAKKGQYHKFKPITNRYMYGAKKPDHKLFQKMS